MRYRSRSPRNSEPADNAEDAGGRNLKDRLEAGKRVAAAATLVTLLLALGKGIIGQLRGSPSLTADAVHSFADTLAIFASWVGLKLAERPPTSRAWTSHAAMTSRTAWFTPSATPLPNRIPDRAP